MQILIYLGIFWLGVIAGVFIKAWLNYRFSERDGTILVQKDMLTEKTVYTLVLDEYPEKLEFKKLVIFKVDTSEKESGRD